MNAAVRFIQTLVQAEAVVGLSDGQLLDRFVARQEEVALEALVVRHGPMVWGVCRRVLRDHHDAEDAFQATFLVLARKAASIMPREKVGNWLYGVAYQTAMKARSTRAKREKRESQVPDAPEPEAATAAQRGDLAELLDRELSRLPDKYRTPIVLCELEGQTHGEAAERLGWPIGTVSGRLSRAKAMLAKMLTRRGASLAVLLANQGMSSANVPSALVSSTVKSATLFATGQATTEVVSVEVVALTGEVLRAMRMSMLYSKIKITAAVLVAFAIVGAGLWQARIWAGPEEPANESFKVTVNEVLREDSIVVTQIGIEAPPGSKLEMSSDKKTGTSVLSADIPKRPNGSSALQLVIVADQFEGKKGEPGTVKFMFSYKIGDISSTSSSSAAMPADGKVSDLLSAPLKSGEYKLGQAMKLVTFKGETFTLIVTRPK